jgi:FtsP/CotA-like multicopper oxidase with cupredoxin domain
MRLVHRFLLSSVVAAACTPENVPPSGEERLVETCGFSPLADVDPSADVVEASLTVDEQAWDPGTGTDVAGRAFNGTVPGPVVEVAVGQTLRLHFRNDTEHPTTVHWHGLRVPEAMDGISQMMNPVRPGGTFTYEFEVKDAGFYWYHPHMDTADALEAGLYGSIVARAPGEAPASCDLPVVLDDVLLDRDTLQIEPPGTAMDQVMGRLGNHLLANGREDRTYEVVAGDVAVLRLVNASNARHMDIGIDGVPLTVHATDGGWLESPYTVDRLVIAPGERYIVALAAPDDVGQEIVVTSRRVYLHHPDGDMMEYDPLGDDETAVFHLRTVEGTSSSFTAPTFDPAPPMTATAPAHSWVLAEDMMAGTVTIDGASWPDVPMVMASADEPTTFVIDNQSEMRHPFHLHGNRFQVVEIDGEPVAEPAWKDTVNVPAETRVTIVSELDNAGEWMYHCHILEHGDAGMAGMMTVE